MPLLKKSQNTKILNETDVNTNNFQNVVIFVKSSLKKLVQPGNLILFIKKFQDEKKEINEDNIKIKYQVILAYKSCC